MSSSTFTWHVSLTKVFLQSAGNRQVYKSSNLSWLIQHPLPDCSVISALLKAHRNTHDLREPQNHHDDCYFFVVEINGINPGNGNKWSYPNLSSAQRPQLKSREVQPSTSKSSNDPNPCDPERNTSSENSHSYYKFSQQPQPFNQKN
ncbi:uncharacterized protein TNCV_3911021 [Trichonephila clavipes]|nr:uncharacterized protein TNCV_3911021 [Trichonephila clavipes]